MSNNLTITKQRLVNASIERVWEALTETKTEWNGILIETISDWVPGSDIIFSFIWDGKQYADKGKILKIEKEKVFSYTYWSAFSGLPDEPQNYSTVAFQLETDDTGTILKLIHSDFATQQMFDDSNANWEGTLDQIKERCEK
jgi:uncharacterized protein YndB with AHSA1/START domain